MKTFTQNEIAKFLGIKQPTVSKYFNGKLEISAKFASKLNKKFGIPFEFWENPKLHLQDNNTKQNRTTTRTQGQSNGN